MGRILLVGREAQERLAVLCRHGVQHDLVQIIPAPVPGIQEVTCWVATRGKRQGYGADDFMGLAALRTMGMERWAGWAGKGVRAPPIPATSNPAFDRTWDK